MMDIILSLLVMSPLCIGGIALIILSKKLKNKKKKIDPTLIQAKVVDIQSKERRNEYGYLQGQYYVITIEYERDNELKINTFDCAYEYPVNSIIDVKIGLGGKVWVYTQPELEGVTYVEGYKVLRVIGIILISIYAGMIFANLPIIDNLFAFLLLLLMVGIPAFFGFKLHKKGKEKLREVQDGIYKKTEVRIIDIQRVYKRNKNSNGGSTYYYPIIEYEINGNIKTTKMNQSMDYRINDIGKTFEIYIKSETDMLTDEGLKYIFLPSKILFIISGIIAFIFLCMAIGII